MSKWLGKTWKGALLAVVTSVFALGSFASAAGQCTNDRWNKVMKRGKIVVGVKADYKPWGYRNTSGGLVGMEIDMAKDVAEAMGVKLESELLSRIIILQEPISCHQKLWA